MLSKVEQKLIVKFYSNFSVVGAGGGEEKHEYLWTTSVLMPLLNHKIASLRFRFEIYEKNENIFDYSKGKSICTIFQLKTNWLIAFQMNPTAMVIIQTTRERWSPAKHIKSVLDYCMLLESRISEEL